MNKPSERIVVFVTPAQKRAISATADNLGISVSELMRRAVLSFGATSEQVKAASIVDRLRAPREPDALNEALQRVARSSNRMRQTAPAALKPRTGSPAASSATSPVASAGVSRVDASAEFPTDSSAAREPATSAGNDAVRDASGKPRETLAPIDLARPADSSAVLAAVGTLESADDANAAQVAARVAAAKAAAIAHDTGEPPAPDSDTRTPSRTATLLSSKRSAASKRQREHEEDEPNIDPTEGNGHFA
jgi:hypothetical protein